MFSYIYGGVRTVFGRHGGAVSHLRADDLMAMVLTNLAANYDLSELEDVIIGCANQAGEDSRNVARMSVLAADLPVTVCGQTVNRLCASGLAAVVTAANATVCGQGNLFIAGGVETMSRSPYVISKTARAWGRDSKMFDSAVGARFPNPKIEKLHGSDTLAQTGDNVAVLMNISRSQADQWAYLSQLKYQQAWKNNFFASEMLAIDHCDKDEQARETSIEKLNSLEPLNQGGIVTAGNSTGINDGAAAVIVGNTSRLEPRARIVSAAVSGIEPRIMGLGPVEAVKKALARADLTMKDLSVIEINEAFAAQILGCLAALDIDFKDSRVNPNGGAIAIGHPLGASGTRLLLTAVNELERRQEQYALVTLCIGMGQGMAMIIERVNSQN